MPGIYIEELDDTSTFTTYDKTIPLVFEYKIPVGLLTNPNTLPQTISWNFGNILPRLICRNENQTTFPNKSTNDWLFTCPVFYHVNNLLQQFRTNWTFIHPFYSSSSISTSSFRSTSMQTFTSSPSPGTHLNLDLDCKTMLKSWRGIDTRTDFGLSSYKAIIEKCTIESYFEEQIQDYNIELTSFYDKIRNNFVSYFNGNSNDGTSNSSPIWNASPTGAEVVGTLLAMQNLMLTQIHVEINRWKDTIYACQNNLIPISILKSTKLEKVLQELRIKLIAKKYNFAFGSMSSSVILTKLFKMKLVECIFGQNSFFIQLLIPVVKESNFYKSVQIHQPKFLYNSENICIVNSNLESKSGPLFNFRRFIYEKNSKTIVETDCGKDSPLCKFPDKSTRSGATDSCLLAVLVGNMESIRSFCHLECDKVPPAIVIPATPSLTTTTIGDSGSSGTMITISQFPLIQRIDSDKFIVTLNKISTILIKCESLGRLDELIPPQKYGAIEIILPCSCYLMFHTEKFYSYEPCNSLINSPSLYHVIPIHMINTTSLELVPTLNNLVTGTIAQRTKYFGISNTNRLRLRYLQPPSRLNSRITFPNVTLFINMTFNEQDIVEEILNDDEDEIDTTAAGLDNNPADAANSKLNISANNSELDKQESIPQFYYAYHGHNGLWSLLILQGFVIVFLGGFVIFKFYMINKRLNEYKYIGENGSSRNHVGTISFSVGGGGLTNPNHSSSQVTLAEKY